MPHRMLTIEEVTDYLHLAPGDVRRLMSETDIPHTLRGGRTLFLRSDVDAWASQRILGLAGKRLDAYHEKSMRGTREIFPDDALIPQLLAPADIDLALPSKTRASVIRDIVALADRTGRVTDPKELVKSIEEREALCPTALPGGLALLHARHHAPFRYEGSFIVLGRTVQAVPFGAPDGRPTRLFFLICCEDDRIHLHALARMALMVMKTDLIDRLLDAANGETAHAALVAAELSVLPRPARAADEND
jgi:excisionase family DNA binding protein